METKPIPAQNNQGIALREDYATISLMHYAQLLNFMGPFGLIVPLILWSGKKHEIKDMDTHGKQILNYQISLLMYSLIFFFLFFISFILTFIFIGFLFMFLLILVAIPLALLNIIPPILGGSAAGKGKYYKYPMTIRFIK
ncbi:DUF4870 domain-containing protein [Spongiimicrobium salis]|uniref:DUF4870 domain-containing protein n=1 Tax=Spongiimicrobium salis TaxID=1667022 RepID=UPI00374D2A7E